MKYRSVKRIRALSLEQLTQEVGASRARRIWDWFHAESTPAQG